MPDMYGATASPLHLGLPTDRLVVTTPTSPIEVERHHPANNGALPLLSPFPRAGDDAITLGDGRPDAVLIEVPSDILTMTRQSPATAKRWRLAVREHFQWALANGYRVVSVRRDVGADREYYELVRRAG